MKDMESDIDKFVGEWANGGGNRLLIAKRTYGTAIVSFFSGRTGEPISRPYLDGLPTANMRARVRDYGRTMEVDLWSRGRGFTLHLTYEPGYELDDEFRDSLVPGLSRRSSDDSVEQYNGLFMPLEHYTRIGAEQSAPADLRNASRPQPR